MLFFTHLIGYFVAVFQSCSPLHSFNTTAKISQQSEQNRTNLFFFRHLMRNTGKGSVAHLKDGAQETRGYLFVIDLLLWNWTQRERLHGLFVTDLSDGLE